jgi:hypothetical protein
MAVSVAVVAELSEPLQVVMVIITVYLEAADHPAPGQIPPVETAVKTPAAAVAVAHTITQLTKEETVALVS